MIDCHLATVAASSLAMARAIDSAWLQVLVPQRLKELDKPDGFAKAVAVADNLADNIRLAAVTICFE